MRLSCVSDLHLEFNPEYEPNFDADILILAGDTGVGLQGIKAAQEWSKHIPVAYVSGNHEHYRESFPSHIDTMRMATAGYTNLHFLENESLVMNDIRVLGCTLWSDFELYGPVNAPKSRILAAKNINDYVMIRHDSERKLTPQDTAKAHAESVAWLKSQLAIPFDGKTVVVTHHAPSAKSIHPRFKQLGDDPLSPAFASNLEYLMGSPISLWISGHTHASMDYTIAGTRCVSNTRGYPNEDISGTTTGTGFNSTLIIEV